ncbi:MAG: hypothetical protein KC619_28025 [Myxococcales bacterium]|nr:hypothetical protein [Myxococcales bacterium]
MKRRVEVFVIRASDGPNGMPQPGGDREVEAPTTDALRVDARSVLEEEGYRVRALSFTEDGLVAYVEERG